MFRLYNAYEKEFSHRSQNLLKTCKQLFIIGLLIFFVGAIAFLFVLDVHACKGSWGSCQGPSSSSGGAGAGTTGGRGAGSGSTIKPGTTWTQAMQSLGRQVLTAGGPPFGNLYSENPDDPFPGVQELPRELPEVADEGEGPPPIGLPKVDPTRDGVVVKNQATPVPRPTAPPRRNNNRRRGNNDDDDREELDRSIREGAARGDDVDEEKDEYRRKYGNPCVYVTPTRIVCAH